MKATFVSQASIIVETKDCVIWTDPWLFGTAFNDSWKLFPEPNWDDSWYEKITHLWISHEHPDHFHIPTLRSLPKEFKERVQLLFQKNNSDKVTNALGKFGFKNIQRLQNRKVTSISEHTKVHNCQVGQMDSSLAVICDNVVLLNVNDCEINKVDCTNYIKDLGHIDVVFNQFSMAGYNGHFDYEKYLPPFAESILDGMIDNHRNLKAKLSIPFASNIYFCCEDNKYINSYGNSPVDVYKKFKKENEKCAILYPSDAIDLSKELETYDSNQALKKFEELYNTRESLDFAKTELVELDEIQKVVEERSNQLKEKFPNFFIKRLKPVTIYIPDLDKKVTLSLMDGTVKRLDSESDDFDLRIYSQPLYFSFKFPWGLQTLGVSSRYLIKDKLDVWRWYRIITSLNNAEIFLKPKFILSKKNLIFIKERLDGGMNQFLYQLKRMKS